MPRALKVFRMPIGFEDAYVAASSRKAALAAWGTEHDQFARGVAEEVTDPTLTAEPLARPGEVIRRSRGDLASQLKALGPRPKKKGKPAAAEEAPPARKVKAAKPKPPPKRDRLDAAEAAVKAAQREHREEMAILEAEREAVERKLEALKAQQDKEFAKLQRKREEARSAYQEALDAWSG